MNNCYSNNYALFTEQIYVFFGFTVFEFLPPYKMIYQVQK